ASRYSRFALTLSAIVGDLIPSSSLYASYLFSESSRLSMTAALCEKARALQKRNERMKRYFFKKKDEPKKLLRTQFRKNEEKAQSIIAVMATCMAPIKKQVQRLFFS